MSAEASSCPRCGARRRDGPGVLPRMRAPPARVARGSGPLPTEARALRLRIGGLAAPRRARAQRSRSPSPPTTPGPGASSPPPAEASPSRTRRGRAEQPPRGLAAHAAAAGRSSSPRSPRRAGATRPSRVAQQARTHGLTARRRPRLVPVREPPPRLLDDVLGPLPERGRRDRLASGVRAPRSRARGCSASSPERVVRR